MRRKRMGPPTGRRTRGRSTGATSRHAERIARNAVKGVHRVVAPSGVEYCYLRADGTPLTSPFGSPEFFVELADKRQKLAAKTAKVAFEEKKTKGKTLGDLIKLYKETGEYKKLSPKTYREKDWLFSWLDDFSDMPLVELTSVVLDKWQEKALEEHKTHFRNRLINIVRILWRLGMRKGLVTATNPADAFKAVKAKLAPGKPQANRPWTRHESDTVMGYVQESLRLPLCIARNTALREEDVVTLTWSAYDRTTITRMQSKGELTTPVIVPVVPELKAMLDRAMLERNPAPEERITLNTWGRPYTPGGLRNSLYVKLRKLEAAGKIAPGLTFHGLRHSFATEIADAGGTAEQIMSITGQTTYAMVHLYTKQAERKSHAKAAIEKVLEYRAKLQQD